VWIFTVAKLLTESNVVTAYTYLLPPIRMPTDEKEKITPTWTDTISGVEVSVYRNEVKGRELPVYKVSRKKWFKDKDGLKSNYSLDRGDWAIARALEREAWRYIAQVARAERAELKAQKASATKADSAAGTEPVIE
jgi:hypothetical protein